MRVATAGAGRARRWPAIVLVLIPVLGLAYALLPGAVFPFDARPGAAVGQTLGVIAGALMLVALLYLPAKRSDGLETSNRRLIRLHIVVAVTGLAVALAHSRLVVNQPPILVLIAFLGLLATGAYGRVIASRRLGDSFGRGGSPFRPTPGAPPELREFIERKRQRLAGLAPGADEGTFALRLSHWARRPARSLRYYVLTLEERQRMRRLDAAGYRTRLEVWERVWRVGHLVLAWLAVLGLAAHAVTTLFFAEFAAGGREIYWWHFK